MAYTFLLSDESVNSYGTRVLTEGIRLGNYEKNPIVLWNHIRAWGDKKDQVLPIGKITRLWREGVNLYGDVEFDQKDEFAQSIESKVKQEIIRACSVSVAIITTSEDAAVVVQGQTRPTVIESELREVSIVDIPSNKNCIVRLCDEETGEELNLSDNEDNFLLPLINTENMNLREELASTLELKSNDEKTIVSAVLALKEAAEKNNILITDNGKLKEELQSYKDKEEEERKTRVKNLVDGGIKARKFTEEEREHYTSLADANFELAEKAIDKLPGVKNPEEEVVNHSEHSAWDKRQEEIKKNFNKNY